MRYDCGIHGTNSALPGDVAVVAAEEAPPSFHAQRDAKGKHYRYRILNLPIRDPLSTRYATWYRDRLDTEAMSAAAFT